jgi:hypothetical protein
VRDLAIMLVAKALRDCRPGPHELERLKEWDAIVRNISGELELSMPQFDVLKFQSACNRTVGQ